MDTCYGHTFRHTYSTLLRSVGTELKVMQELLRHSSLRSTLDVYTQAITPAKHAAQAAVMSLVFSFYSVLLEFKKGFPYIGFKEAGSTQIRVGLPGVLEKAFENVKEGLVINELWSGVFIELLQILQNLFLDVLDEAIVVPDFVKPLLKLLTVPIAIDGKV
jgi:hypothetical protein